MFRGMRSTWVGGLILATMFVLGCGKSSMDMQAIHRYNDLGVAYMEQHNYYAASQEFQKALEIAPNYTIGRINLGIAYFTLSMYTEAEAEFEKALKLDPSNPYAHFNLGLVHKVQGQYEKAGKSFEEVRKVDSEDPFIHYNLGIVFSKRGRRTEAIQAYRRVIALDPNNVSAYYTLAGELMRAGKPEESKQVLGIFNEKRASGLNPTVGVRYLEQGKYAEAIVDRAHRAEAKAGDRVIPVKFVDATAQAGLKRGQGSGVRGNPKSEIRNPKSEIEVARMGSAVAFEDYDGDGDLDVYWVRCSTSKAASTNVLYRNNGDGTFTDVTQEAGVGDDAMGMACAFGDYDNDGDRDLYVANYGANVLYRNNGDGTFTDVTQIAGVADYGSGKKIRNPQSAIRNPRWGMGCAFGDYDHDGDIDLYIAHYVDLKAVPSGSSMEDAPQRRKDRGEILQGSKGPGGQGGSPPLLRSSAPLQGFGGQSNTLYRNNGNGTFADVTAQVGVGDGARRSVAVLFTDFDNDRDVDVYVVNDGEPNALYSNNRDGTFSDVAALAGVADAGHAKTVAGGDYDKDDRIDLLVASRDGADILYRNSKDGTFSQDPVLSERTSEFEGSRIGGFFDYDNDGDLDVFMLSAAKFLLLRNRGDGTFAEASDVFGERKGAVRDVALGDYDDDGDVDILIADEGGLRLLRNDGGNANHWLKIQLVGAGSNKDGIGCKVSVKAGPVWQKVEVRGTSQRSLELAFGVGKAEKVEMVRILWPGGVRQAELDVQANQTLEVTEVDRKGTSCPLLYAWNGSRFEFVTDFLGMAATGEFVSPGVYAYPDVDEYIKIEGSQLRPHDGVYPIRIATQLEEIALIDQVRLIAVDHPSEVDVVPNEKAAFSGAYPAFKLYTVRDLRPPVAAHDDRGRDILPLILEQDRTYPEGFTLLPLQGYAEMHHIVLDLGDLSGAEQIILLLNGTLKYAGSNSNLAAYQMGLELHPPRLEVINAKGAWETALEDMGIPAGEPKTIPVDLTGKFPADDYRVRITTNVPIYWDQITISTYSGSAPVRTTDLAMRRAEMRWLGYPRRYSPDGKWPPIYDYHDARTTDLWRDMSGWYTRYGDVRDLLREIDDRFVITRHGDEVAFEFEVESAPPLDEGWSRDFLFYANGFGKDTTINSAYSNTVEPLPFHGMSRYPYGEEERDPYDEAHVSYVERYNTRGILWTGE